MPTTASSSPAKPRPLNWRKFARRAGIALAAGLILLLVVFFLLPVWISNEQGRAYVLQRINHHLNQGVMGPGVSVMVDEWSLGWFRASDLKNLRILRADGTTLLSCPRVKSGLTLWDIWWGHYDLGNTTADKLELTIIKYPDGHTSLGDLALANDWVATVRGGLQIIDGKVILTSFKTGQTERFSDVKAALTIAAPEIPFHLQISAAGNSDLSSGRILAGDVSINATLPALSSLAQGGAGVTLWSLLGDAEFSATNIPSGVFCDCLGFDAAWADSLGQTLEIVRFSNHATAPLDASRPALSVRGIGPASPNGMPPEATQIDARLLLHGIAAAGPWTLSRPAGDDEFQIEATLRMSSALAGLLRHIHPMLGETQAAITPGLPEVTPLIPAPGNPSPTNGLVHLTLSSLTLSGGGSGESSEAAGRISFPPLSFTTNTPHANMTTQLQSLLGNRAAAGPDHLIDGSAGVLRFTLNNNNFTYDNFVITLGRANINFSGTVSLQGSVSLIARLPADITTPLSSSTMQVLIGGTIDTPTVRRAE